MQQHQGADFYLQKGGDPIPQFTELSYKIREAVQQRWAEASIRDHERRGQAAFTPLPRKRDPGENRDGSLWK
jgi:hypothetical protein